jgi:hypothetical protein
VGETEGISCWTAVGPLGLGGGTEGLGRPNRDSEADCGFGASEKQ